MASAYPLPEEFVEVAQYWDVQRLYADLTAAKKTWSPHKRRGLSEIEWKHLLGLLCGYSPEEMAQKLHKDPGGINSALVKTVYRYVETLTKRPANSLKNWRDVVDWLEVDYKIKSFSVASELKDWDGAPDVCIYGRNEELATLKQWIVQDRCRLVAILGLGGIGKTALSVQLARQIAGKFEYVLWRSLRNAPPVLELLGNWLQSFSHPILTDNSVVLSDRLSRLIEFLRIHQCLLVLEDVQMVMGSEQLAGNYKKGYEGYAELFRRIGESQHKSCLILTSWEKPREIAAIEGPNSSVRSFQMNGLKAAFAREILREKGLEEPEKWDELINPYRGNPWALKIVATTIRDVFGCRVSEFLKINTLFLGDFEYLLYDQFKRLSQLEKEIMCGLAAERQPLTIGQLRKAIQVEVSLSELIKVLESLGRRSLLEQVPENTETLFALQPVVMKYVLQQYPCR